MEGSENASYYEGVFDDATEDEVEVEFVEEVIVEKPIEDDAYRLIYKGELTDVVEFGAHKFKLKTLKIGEELEASLLASRYENTVDAGRALATALVAASIVTVDDEPLVELIGPGEKSLDAKFKYITENWYWFTVAKLYETYDSLLNRSLKVLDELKKD